MRKSPSLAYIATATTRSLIILLVTEEWHDSIVGETFA
jgi:hypothetical protein